MVGQVRIRRGPGPASRPGWYATAMPEDSSSREPNPELGPPPTPFDHPLFLPALLIAGVIWFGYDAWLNPAYQPGGEQHEHLTFSRGGFFVLLVLGAWFGYKGWGEWQEDRAKSESDSDSQST